jgi:arsenate reductase
VSAGAPPAERVHPPVVEAMRELGIDVSDRVARRLNRELAEKPDVLVTMGSGDECAYIPDECDIDWTFKGPRATPRRGTHHPR